MASEEITKLWRLREDVELVQLAKRADAPAWKSAWRARDRWHPRWRREVTKQFIKSRQHVSLQHIAETGRAAWTVGKLRKAKARPSPEEVAAQLRAEMPPDEFGQGALAAYLALALDEGEDSGQHTLDSLGLDETFAWAQAREFAGNALAIRGSKILAKAYETHVDELAKLVIAKCDPAQPKTIRELTKEIHANWNLLTKKQAERIARTEAAFVWETTNWNAMHLNGVERVDWLIASGPSVGKSRGPVCEDCLALAAESPYDLGDMRVIPPAHPYCSCTLVKHYEPGEIWLPPAEPFTGAQHKLEIFT